MPIFYLKIWVPNFFFKTDIPSTLTQNVLYKFRNDFKSNQCTVDRDLEQQNPQNGSTAEKLSPKKHGKLLGKISYPKIWLTSYISDPKNMARTSPHTNVLRTPLGFLVGLNPGRGDYLTFATGVLVCFLGSENGVDESI